MHLFVRMKLHWLSVALIFLIKDLDLIWMDICHERPDTRSLCPLDVLKHSKSRGLISFQAQYIIFTICQIAWFRGLRPRNSSKSGTAKPHQVPNVTRSKLLLLPLLQIISTNLSLQSMLHFTRRVSRSFKRKFLRANYCIYSNFKKHPDMSK